MATAGRHRLSPVGKVALHHLPSFDRSRRAIALSLMDGPGTGGTVGACALGAQPQCVQLSLPDLARALMRRSFLLGAALYLTVFVVVAGLIRNATGAPKQ